MIWILRISAYSRLCLTLVLGLGLFAAAAGMVRQANATRTFTEPEPWVCDTYAVWNFIGLEMGIIAASLPAIKPLLVSLYDSTNGCP